MTTKSKKFKYLSSDINSEKKGIQFNNLDQSRGRTARAYSLALPNHSLIDLFENNQSIYKSINLTPPPASNQIRRHSSHYYPMTESDDLSQNTPQVLPLIPPPVPKRTFQGKFSSHLTRDNMNSYNINNNNNNTNNINNNNSSSNNNNNNNNNTTSSYSSPHKYRLDKYKCNDQSYTLNSYLDKTDYSTNIYNNHNSSSVSSEKQREKLKYHSVSSASYDDIGDTDDLVLFEKKIQKSIDSNRSSSDSNRSQTTIDTGYVSSSNDTDRSVFTNGTSASLNNHHSFRSRFSSEDTQSSMDSFLSSDLQRTDTIDSLQTNDSPFSLKKNVFNFDQKIRDRDRHNNYEDSSQKYQYQPPKPTKSRRLPVVPARKPKMGQAKLPSPGGMSVSYNSKLPDSPSTPPNAKQSGMAGVAGGGGGGGGGVGSLAMDKSKIFQCGQMMRNTNFHHNANKDMMTSSFNASVNNGNSMNNNNVNNMSNKNGESMDIQEMCSRPMGGMRKSFNGGNKHKPPPLNQMHHTKINQRQDSNISSDSYSLTSSPGYNSKTMEAPLLQHASKINKSSMMRHQESNDSFTRVMRTNTATHGSNRQDSNISSDSYSQSSSPGYNTKLSEAPLLAHTGILHPKKPITFKDSTDEIVKEPIAAEKDANVPITKSVSTPASLQAIVKLSNGSAGNSSLQHKVLNKVRKTSSSYISNGPMKFRLWQILCNAFALLVIAGGIAAYFNAYPTIKFIHKTIFKHTKEEPGPDNIFNIDQRLNPAPGVCLPIIVKFCHQHKVPYNFTVFPNYMGHFVQPESQLELDHFEALVDVQCYELVPLFLCTLFVPKCGPTGVTVPPCKSLCVETMRRCSFFFDVFGLDLPEYLTCRLFAESTNPDECVGNQEVRDARIRAQHPICSGFLCDQKRCLPNDWVCDGHVDCLDQSDEAECSVCGPNAIHCGNNKCMSEKHICDGIHDCPWGQDERNCIRLSERNGDLGRGVLEIYKADIKQWSPACVQNWDTPTSPAMICSMLGYSSVNATKVTQRGSNVTLNKSLTRDGINIMRMYPKKHYNMFKDFSNCSTKKDYLLVELTCSNFECGKIRKRYRKPSLRIYGGSKSNPGDWPFLAAILGGPEEIFYCAGVLIADQWVLTASHCIGNHTQRNPSDWTIQLGITRRHSHTYYGQKVRVKNVIPHPQYNTQVAHDNDIALFQLATRVAFNEHLLPVCLPPIHMRELKPGTNCTVIGWGKSNEKNGNPSSIKHTYELSVNEVQVPIINRDVCNDWLEMLNVTDGMICAGYEEGGRDACQGDSGGPLLCPHPNDKDRWFVGGIVSWGIMCAHPKLPGVYANVPKYIPWITQQIHKYSILPSDNNNVGR